MTLREILIDRKFNLNQKFNVPSVHLKALFWRGGVRNIRDYLRASRGSDLLGLDEDLLELFKASSVGALGGCVRAL